MLYYDNNHIDIYLVVVSFFISNIHRVYFHLYINNVFGGIYEGAISMSVLHIIKHGDLWCIMDRNELASHHMNELSKVFLAKFIYIGRHH